MSLKFSNDNGVGIEITDGRGYVCIPGVHGLYPGVSSSVQQDFVSYLPMPPSPRAILEPLISITGLEINIAHGYTLFLVVKSPDDLLGGGIGKETSVS
jgi:hypothetical protein